MENNEKINNTAFLQLIKNYEIGEKENKKKLIDKFLNFPIEKFLIFNIFFSKLSKFFKEKLEHKRIFSSFSFMNKIKYKYFKTSKNFDSNKKTEQHEPFLTDISGKEVLLYKFEADFMKLCLIEKNKFSYNPKKILNNKLHLNKKISNYIYSNKNSQQRNANVIERIKAKSSETGNENDKEQITNINTLNQFYYIKLLHQLKKREKQYNSRQLNLRNEIRFLQMRIRNKKISKVKKVIKQILRFTNIKNLMDLKNTKNTIQATFVTLSKYIRLYKQSMNELVEGQREVTQNKNFKFEDGETVKEKIDKFEKKLKENVNLNDHYEKKG